MKTLFLFLAVLCLDGPKIMEKITLAEAWIVGLDGTEN